MKAPRFFSFAMALCTALIWAGCAAPAFGALTLVALEPFVGPGQLTSGNPDHFSSVNGTLTEVRVGPRPMPNAVPGLTDDAPGWSADIRTSGSVNYRGTVALSGATAQCGLWGAWFRVKALPPSGGYLSILQLLDAGTNVVMDFKVGSNGVISYQPYSNNSPSPTLTGPTLPLNTWIWLGVAWQVPTPNSAVYNLRCLSMPLGGSLTTWGSANGLIGASFTFTSVNVGLQTGGTGPMLRVGCPSLYSMSSFSDIAYPPDVIPPVEGSYSWYVNPKSGSDNNDGSTAATAWQTADKLTLESQYCGLLDSNAAGPGNGDVVTIDTSASPLVIDAIPLTINTQGVAVQPASGQTYIKCQAEEFLSNAAFKPVPGLSKTYQTSDTQTDIVTWENDKWMWHVKSSSYGAAAAITNPPTGVTTNYPSTGAALDAVPGSFYTDGTTLYIHPFGDTNPASDGKVYTRSINRTMLGAVVFSAGNYRASGFYVRKTTLVDSADNDFGAYCFQDQVLSGSGISNLVENCYFGYGDKHCFGSTCGVTASTLLVRNVDCEQGHPYCGYGGQTPFVSYSGVTTADNVHTYQNCTCLARSGLIGSTAGDPNGTGGDILLSHNNGTGNSFASITIDGCNFASGSMSMGVANELLITDHTSLGILQDYNSAVVVQESTLTGDGVEMQPGATSLIMQNCVIKPTLGPSLTNFQGSTLRGTVTIQDCTFDLSGLAGGTTQLPACLQRVGPLNLTFENNVYVVPSTLNSPPLGPLFSSDQLVFDHNAYDLGAGTTFALNYTDASGALSQLTFPQWQALGYDCINSSLNANLNLQNDVPQTGSPLLNDGVDFGLMADFTGTAYPHRNTIGAYQGSAAYRAQQSLTSFPPLANDADTTVVHLPSTTDAGLAVTYTVVSGPAQLTGNTLHFTGDGTVTLTATQAGDGSDAPLSATETITVAPPEAPGTDTPTLTQWALIAMGVLLALSASRSLGPVARPSA